MADDLTTNDKIAALLLEQTYAERLEMAASFRDMIFDILDEPHSGGPDADDMMTLFQGWAEAQQEDALKAANAA
jgi:hypothetical protein